VAWSGVIDEVLGIYLKALSASGEQVPST